MGRLQGITSYGTNRLLAYSKDGNLHFLSHSVCFKLLNTFVTHTVVAFQLVDVSTSDMSDSQARSVYQEECAAHEFNLQSGQ